MTVSGIPCILMLFFLDLSSSSSTLFDSLVTSSSSAELSNCETLQSLLYMFYMFCFFDQALEISLKFAHHKMEIGLKIVSE